MRDRTANSRLFALALSLGAALASLRDPAHLAQTIARVAAAREKIALTAAANGLQPSTTATEPTTEISTAPSGVD